MPPASYSSGRIAKNTVMLYVRMLVMMAVMLYVSRVVLRVLGVEDFGIYNLVGGIVVMFSFLNTAMATSTQRFINYELGCGSEECVQKVFNTSMIIHIVLVGLVILLAETVGLWFLNTQLNIPTDRITAANWVYQFSLLTFCVEIIKVPYNATIIAYEKMTFYAYASIVEAVLQLLVVYFLLVTSADKLVLYAGLLLVVSVIIWLVYYFFCRMRFRVTRLKFVWDKVYIKRITGFSGWTLFGSVANVGALQGINIFLNIFYGVAVNAAVGVATQLSSAVYRFISNFGLAYRPQIVQLYAAGKDRELSNLIFKSSKFSYFLFLILSVPVFAYCGPILHIWLGEVPEYSVSFCRFIMLYLLVDAAATPLWATVEATGKIRNYYIIMSLLILSNIPLTYICLRTGLPPYSVWAVRFLLNVIAYIFRFTYLKRVMNFAVGEYVRKVVLVILTVTVLAVPVPLLLVNVTHGLAGVIMGVAGSMISVAAAAYCFGLTKPETAFVNSLILKVLKR